MHRERGCVSEMANAFLDNEHSCDSADDRIPRELLRVEAAPPEDLQGPAADDPVPAGGVPEPAQALHSDAVPGRRGAADDFHAAVLPLPLGGLHGVSAAADQLRDGLGLLLRVGDPLRHDVPEGLPAHHRRVQLRQVLQPHRHAHRREARRQGHLQLRY